MGSVPSQFDKAIRNFLRPVKTVETRRKPKKRRHITLKNRTIPIVTEGTHGGGASNYDYDPATGLSHTRLDFRDRPNTKQRWKDPTKPGELYTDLEFPLDVAIEEYKKEKIQWKRPREFRDNPVLFSDGTTIYEVGQRSAGTCWFVSMVADLAKNEDTIYKNIPLDGWNPDTGVLKCVFYHFGEWVTVYTDDFLPVVDGETLWGAGSFSDNNEMWVSMLEKCFARLHGSYNAIYGGQACDSYLALTGGVAEVLDFRKQKPDPDQFFARVRNSLRAGSYLTCSILATYNAYKGLIADHAYSLTGVGVVHTKDCGNVCLLRIRNPWGFHEWKGAWSDRSKEWESVVEKTLDHTKKDDGEFWMCLDDYMKY
ncbi:calpain-8-like isoform X1 [Gigantopelta aegis]|uniref:calpain-8-like isoform X1 n=1 Tax=Gigantopelta aegis TaxID=1735272 RepID=UPI001B88765B|nr:calpain-8-like isoform X1 [Gigantopelta aegis]XP_041347255.1 calpain-8-like isoform X1 [Gigantopelta aegis]